MRVASFLFFLRGEEEGMREEDERGNKREREEGRGSKRMEEERERNATLETRGTRGT